MSEQTPFTPTELQKLVLLTGSKKGLGTYLGWDTRQLETNWTTNGLKTPLTWLRTQDRATQLELLAKAGSLKLLARRLGCSEAALRPIYQGEPTRALDWDQDHLTQQLDRFGSVRAVAHMNDTSESLVRRRAEELGLDLADLVDYSTSNHANAKGRRAELEFARLRGDRILLDRNRTDGSQATHDFDDADLGRVNVKSSRQWRYKAQSRAESPDFWKMSNRGWQTADHLICLCYDRKYEQLIGVYKVDTTLNPCTKTIIVTRDQLEPPCVLSP